MYDKSLVLDILEQIIDAIEIVEERCQYATTQDDVMYALKIITIRDIYSD